jgi:hypothetical protein
MASGAGGLKYPKGQGNCGKDEGLSCEAAKIRGFAGKQGPVFGIS